jgi:hypothetical protein
LFHSSKTEPGVATLKRPGDSVARSFFAYSETRMFT